MSLVYDFYAIECRHISKTACGIESVYTARANRPTIVYVDDNKNTVQYHATQLRLGGKIHPVIAGVSSGHDGELIMRHEPSTASLPIECHFPFVHDARHETTDIDAFLRSDYDSHFTNLYVDMNAHIADATAASQYKKKDKDGKEIRVILFHQLITVRTDIKTLYKVSQYCVDQLQRQTLEYKLQTPAIIKRKKRSVIDAKSERGTQTEKEKEKEKEKKKEKEKELGGAIEGFAKGQDGEGGGGGGGGGGGEEVIYECEYLPVDSDDMIQVLQIPLSSPGLDTLVNSNVSSLFINNAIILFVVVLIFFTMPLFYRFIRIKVLKTKYSFLFDEIAFLMRNFDLSMNLVGVGAVTLCIALTVLLLVLGFVLHNSTSVAIGIFLPFFAFFSYISIAHRT